MMHRTYRQMPVSHEYNGSVSVTGLFFDSTQI